mmetsp:Transcript_4391/g.10709  ORF Transcript_4391/g.10709 Transcript_4391/m.10709 type:complete len:290 (-) Transcript_4391:44-913(-)
MVSAAKAAGAGLPLQLQKTKLCAYHVQGKCHFGQKCTFAHTDRELQHLPDLRKTRLCKDFAEGKCKNPDCAFAHSSTELRYTDMFFKKSLCMWYAQGKCRNGAMCRFAHGAEELRAFAMAPPPGLPYGQPLEDAAHNGTIGSDMFLPPNHPKFYNNADAVKEWGAEFVRTEKIRTGRGTKQPAAVVPANELPVEGEQELRRRAMEESARAASLFDNLQDLQLHLLGRSALGPHGPSEGELRTKINALQEQVRSLSERWHCGIAKQERLQPPDVLPMGTSLLEQKAKRMQ